MHAMAPKLNEVELTHHRRERDDGWYGHKCCFYCEINHNFSLDSVQLRSRPWSWEESRWIREECIYGTTDQVKNTFEAFTLADFDNCSGFWPDNFASTYCVRCMRLIA